MSRLDLRMDSTIFQLPMDRPTSQSSSPFEKAGGHFCSIGMLVCLSVRCLFVIDAGTRSYVMHHVEAFRLGRLVQLSTKHVRSDVVLRESAQTMKRHKKRMFVLVRNLKNSAKLQQLLRKRQDLML